MRELLAGERPSLCHLLRFDLRVEHADLSLGAVDLADRTALALVDGEPLVDCVSARAAKGVASTFLEHEPVLRTRAHEGVVRDRCAAHRRPPSIGSIKASCR